MTPPLRAAVTLSVGIRLDADAAYERMWRPESFARWAAGLGTAFSRTPSGWIAETGRGPVKVHFTEHNRFGVLDHTVLRPGGERVFVPLRVVANGTGCEVMLTLFRSAGTTDAALASDLAAVDRDLQSLRAWLEGG